MATRGTARGRGRRRRPARQRRRQQPGRDAAARSQVHLSKCIREYAIAMSNGFVARRIGAAPCVPDTIVIPSKKTSVFSRGTFSTSAANYGYIVFKDHNPGNDGNAILATAAGSTGGPSFALTTYSMTDDFEWISQYPAAAFSDTTKQFRTVSLSVRIRYAGTELNRGGTMLAFEHPNHDDITAESYASIATYENTTVHKVTNEWTYIHWSPKKTFDVQYGSTTATYVLGMLLNSAVVSQPFYYEAVSFLEVIGKAESGTTASHSDPVGFGAVQEVMSNPLASKAPSKVLDEVSHAVANTASFVKTYGPGIATVAKEAFDLASLVF